MHWSDKRYIRSVTNLKLWEENPRLERSYESRSERDIIKEIVDNDANFINLVRSIAQEGFQYFDIIVVFRDDNSQHKVLEGNRRVAALKLLLDPSLAPDNKKHTFRRLSGDVSAYSTVPGTVGSHKHRLQNRLGACTVGAMGDPRPGDRLIPDNNGISRNHRITGSVEMNENRISAPLPSAILVKR